MKLYIKAADDKSTGRVIYYMTKSKGRVGNNYSWHKTDEYPSKEAVRRHYKNSGQTCSIPYIYYEDEMSENLKHQIDNQINGNRS